MNEQAVVFLRELLYEEIWEQSLSKTAKKYNISNDKLKKACLEAEIPLPTNSYWGKVNMGIPAEKTPLPESAIKEISIEHCRKSMNHVKEFSAENPEEKQTTEKEKKELEADVQKVASQIEELTFLSDIEKEKLISVIAGLRVPVEGKRLHPVLRKHKTIYKEWEKNHPRDNLANWKRDSYRSHREGEPPLWECVSKQTLPRVYRILDVVFRAVEELGGNVNEDFSLTIRNEHVCFQITEGKDQVPHTITAAEQKQLDEYHNASYHYSWESEPRFRKYDYIANGKLRFSAYEKSHIIDTNIILIDMRVREILVELYKQSEVERVKREAREEQERLRQEKKRQDEILRQKYNNEVENLQILLNKADDFETACRIRRYVAAVENAEYEKEETTVWAKWAREKADWYDPVVAKNDPIFGVRKHGEKSELKDPKKRYGYYW